MVVYDVEPAILFTSIFLALYLVQGASQLYCFDLGFTVSVKQHNFRIRIIIFLFSWWELLGVLGIPTSS